MRLKTIETLLNTLQSNKGGYMTNTANVDSLKVLSGKVGIIVKSGSSTPYEKMDDWQKKANSYRLTLIYQGRKYSFD